MPPKIKLITISLVSGILIGLAPEPGNAWYFAWIALAPLWILIRQQKSLQQVVILGLAWGVGYYGLALFWITGVHPMTWMGVPWLASLSIAIFCWVFITFWGVGLAVTWSLLVAFVNRKIDSNQLSGSLIRVLIGVALWCGLETLWSNGPLWWSAIAHTQSPHNLIILQLGKISGQNTVTAVIVAVNGLLAEAVLFWRGSLKLRPKLFLLISPLFVLITSHLVGYFLYQIPIAKDNLAPLKVGIIQGNIPNEIKLFSQGWQKAITGYTSGYQRLARQGVDVVLTPEGALPFYWSDIIDNSSFYRAVITEKVPAWVGAWKRNQSSYHTSLFTVTGEGKTYSRYDKYKLVPLGEYIPLESILGDFINRLSPLEAHLSPGKRNQIFDTPFGKAIVAICYESAFPQHFQRQTKAGGEFIITSSNNAHYSKAMPAQHHAHDVMRAIENDRWAARATNTGYSAIVDPHGNTLWISDMNQYVIHQHTIYRRQTKHLYVRSGDWLTPTLLIFSGLLGFLVQNQSENRKHI
ncbi:apolipoprotein N-acyltransferase [Pleurocapsa sp. PCC 7319]|uniref:apolipoprotein N-acyltransferase n=1 Tax=Pleurocapsa sp. PCC 7319 TaxID=118161 RepID=UPI0003462B90|nr:apolipoprotein N-acyltransferase [Pleurocapsa sp. PCC 7319]